MEQLIPDAGLVVLDGAGHYSYIDQAARFARIVSHFIAPPDPPARAGGGRFAGHRRIQRCRERPVSLYKRDAPCARRFVGHRRIRPFRAGRVVSLYKRDAPRARAGHRAFERITLSGTPQR